MEENKDKGIDKYNVHWKARVNLHIIASLPLHIILYQSETGGSDDSRLAPTNDLLIV